MTDQETTWAKGDPGPNGLPLRDGMWPCQCFTCSACSNPTMLTAEEGAERPEAVNVKCVICTKQGHRQRPRVDRVWVRPLASNPNPGRPDEREWDAAQERRAAKETRRRIHVEQVSEWEENLEPRFKNATLDGHVDPTALQHILKFMAATQNPSKGSINLALVGTLGVGKTYLMHAITRALVHEGHVLPKGIRFGTEGELLTPLTQGLPSDRKALLTRLTDPKRVSMLFIDEVGRAKYSDADDQRYVWDVITDFAYENDIPLVVATNLVPDVALPPAVIPEAASNPFSKSNVAEDDDGERGWEAATVPAIEGGVPSAHGEASQLFLSEYMGDAAYNRLLTNTPFSMVTTVKGGNRRPDVKDGDVPR